MVNRITLRSYSSKGVNNQMEVNDRPMQSGGDDENMTKALKTEILHSRWLFTCSFFNELKRGEKHLIMTYVYFFNELELCAKTGRLIQSYNKDVSSKMPIFMELAPYKILLRSLLHAS